MSDPIFPPDQLRAELITLLNKRLQNMVSGHVLEKMDVQVAHDAVTDKFVEVVTGFFYGAVAGEKVEEYHAWPKNSWEALKQESPIMRLILRCLPASMKSWAAPKMEIRESRKVIQFLCPHLNESPQEHHLAWLRSQDVQLGGQLAVMLHAVRTIKQKSGISQVYMKDAMVKRCMSEIVSACDKALLTVDRNMKGELHAKV